MTVLCSIIKKIVCFKSCIQGATVVEYALIAAAMAGAIIASVFLFGDEMVVTIELLTASLESAQDRIAVPESD